MAKLCSAGKFEEPSKEAAGSHHYTGSVRYTRLDSLLMEAAMTWEFTAMVLFRPTKSLPSFMVAFSVLRNRPKLL
uniref:Uncharacterized protein n=1 Tax=Chrysemys picta bellii TaxID=8478 RepID=A0A8C3HVE8_CHRPI